MHTSQPALDAECFLTTLLRGPARPALQRIARLAARAAAAPMAFVWMGSGESAWVAASFGLEGSEVDSLASLCVHIPRLPAPVVVADVRESPVFREHAMLQGATPIRALAAIPVDGDGGLCLMDRVPRTFDDEALENLSDLAYLVSREVRAARLGIVPTRIPQGVLYLDRDLRVLQANQTALQILDWGTDLVGQPFQVLLAPPLDLLEPSEIVRRFAPTEEMTDELSHEVDIRRSDASIFTGDLVLLTWVWQEETMFLAILRDLSRRKAFDQQLSRVSRELKGVLDGATQFAVIAWDPTGIITHFNRGAELMLGYSAGELEGWQTPLLLHFPSELEVRARELESELGHRIVGIEVLTEGARHGPYEERQWTWVRRDGGRIIVSLTVTAQRDFMGAIHGYVGVAADVTHRLAVERMRNEFVGMASHEIRTPLTAIRASLGLLEAGRFGELLPAGRRMLQIAVKNTDRMVRLINDLLDIERIESGRSPLDRRVHRVRALVQASAEPLSARLEEAGVALELDAGDDEICVDGDRIVQTITNLVTNAIKFSERGQTVRVVARPLGAEVKFEIIDQGRGIPPEKLGLLFQRFQQVELADSREKGGSGLGLAISRGIVEQHGGHIGVDSELGKGSCFWFTVPRGAVSSSA